MLWHEMSWPELDRVSRDVPVVVPLGSCEQHGHHLPVGVDTLQVEAIARDVESRLRDRMLLTQTMWLGSSHHHKDFPGTISIPPSAYAHVIRGVADSLLHNGFRRLFFLNGHGGNRVPAAQALTELIGTDDRAESAMIALSSWWEVASDAVANAGIEQPAIAHACEVETSLMYAIRDDLVRMERIRSAAPAFVNQWFHSENDRAKKVTVFHRFHRITAAGSLGNSSAATREKGILLREGIVREIVAFLSDFQQWTLPPKLGPALDSIAM